MSKVVPVFSKIMDKNTVPKRWLSGSNTLMGKDMLPLVLQLQGGPNDALKELSKKQPGELASFKEGHLLQSFSDAELVESFKKLTGYDLKVSASTMSTAGYPKFQVRDAIRPRGRDHSFIMAPLLQFSNFKGVY